jgi:anti-sigma B factor antagonist
MEKYMRFEESRIGNVFVAKVLESRISADIAPRFKEDIISFVTRGNRTLVLDLRVIGNDGELMLSGVRDTVASMFKLTRMNKVFRMFPTPEEAAAAVL